ncbi:DUF6270 domain-containing protein [Naumannella huperziae]
MTRTFIMGSCVSRDTFEHLPERFRLAGYVARQSLVSVGRPVPDSTLPYAELDSAFQRRMLAGDLAGNAIDQLDAASTVDLVLWDLTDERLGAHRAGDGWFTRTIEGIGADFYPAGLPHVAYGTDEHFAAWSRALPRWIGALADRDLLGRTVFLQVPWAAITTEDHPTPVSFGLSAEAANAATFRYQRAIMDAAPELTMIRPRDRVRARPGHQWGLAPFHYTEDVYRDLTDQLDALTR